MELLSVARQLRQPNAVPNPNPVTESQLPLTGVITSLEEATLTVKALSSTTDPSHRLHAYASLRNAYNQIGSVLARFHPHPQTVENSVCIGGGEQDEPMADEDSEEEEEAESSKIIEKVERGMKDCVLNQSKRRKRPLSPYWVAQQSMEDGVRDAALFNQRDRIRSFDLILQFHG